MGPFSAVPLLIQRTRALGCCRAASAGPYQQCPRTRALHIHRNGIAASIVQ
jgi:hypothetical protein